MIEKLDRALMDLTDMTIDVIEEAKANGQYSLDFIESACIVLSMAYGRFQEDGDNND